MNSAVTLPNFIIIGAAKSGTTSLHYYLDQHPQIFMCPLKEANYFLSETGMLGVRDEDPNAPHPPRFRPSTLAAYAALFAGATDEIAIGEASPRYFSCPSAARQIRDCIPEAKLVVSLRNPAERAFSGFLMRVRKGRSALNIRQGLAPESHHVKEGFYYRWLQPYFETFPREQIKVILFEEFKQDPVRVTQELFRFLGVDPTFAPDTTIKHNPAAVPRFRLLNKIYYNPAVIRAAKTLLPEQLQKAMKRFRQLNARKPPAFPADLHTELLALYRDDILRLQDLLDRDLSLWLDGLSWKGNGQKE